MSIAQTFGLNGFETRWNFAADATAVFNAKSSYSSTFAAIGKFTQVFPAMATTFAVNAGSFRAP